MSKEGSNRGAMTASLAILGPPGQGKTWLATQLARYWRRQAWPVSRLMIDTGRGSEWARALVPEALAARQETGEDGVHWPPVTTREAFESWLAETLYSFSEEEEWLVWGPLSPGHGPVALPSLLAYALPRLMQQVAGCSVLDDPPPWLMQSLPTEGALPLWVVTERAVLEGWQPPDLPWTGHAPGVVLNPIAPADDKALLADRIAQLQAEHSRLAYWGRLPVLAPAANNGMTEAWVGDWLTRLPLPGWA